MHTGNPITSRTRALRLLACAARRHAAASLDESAPSATLNAAMAKRFATDACYDVANQALQLLGGYGYLSEYPIERYMRDLRVHSILEVRRGPGEGGGTHQRARQLPLQCGASPSARLS